MRLSSEISIVMSEFIPIKENGINPVEYVKPYFTLLDDRDLSILLGSVLFQRKIQYKLLQSLLNLNKLEVEEKLGRILQTDLWEGDFSRNSFTLTKLNYAIAQQQPVLNLEEKTILAYLKARYTITISELQKVFSLNFESAIQYIASFITRGLISTEFVNNNNFQVIVYFSLPAKEVNEITKLEKQIVGFVGLHDFVSVKAISSGLQIPEHQIQSSLTELILSDMILCSFDVNYSKMKSIDVLVKIKHFLINFPQRGINIMTANEKLIIGISSLQKGVSLHDASKLLSVSVVEILSIISILNATREFNFKIMKASFIVPISVPVFQVNTKIEDIDRNSLINYRSLFGLIKTKRTITVREISKKMNISSLNVIKGLVDLYLNGLIMGELSDLSKFKLETVRNIQEEYITLEYFEKVIIGGLLSEGKLSMAKLGALLDLNKIQTQERALAFISRNIGDTSISNAFLTLRKQIKIPPLIQINNLEPVDQQLFTFLVTNRIVTLKKLRSTFSLSNQEIYRRVYYLSGSGLLLIKTQKQTFTVLEHQITIPIDPIDALDHDLRLLILNIEKLNSNQIRLSKLASMLEWDTDEVNLDISYLVGFGYYKGYIKGRKFYKKSPLFKFKDKPKCFSCGHSLDNFREPCPSCFTQSPQCSVCRSRMNSSEDIVACHHCKNTAHRIHILEWLKIKGFCPICRNSLRADDLEPLTLDQENTD